jgi:thymidine phosphorylase
MELLTIRYDSFALVLISPKEHVVFMRKDCHICLSEGFEALNRVLVTVKGKSKIATLYFSNDGILQPGEAGLSESTWTYMLKKEMKLVFHMFSP